MRNCQTSLAYSSQLCAKSLIDAQNPDSETPSPLQTRKIINVMLHYPHHCQRPKAKKLLPRGTVRLSMPHCEKDSKKVAKRAVRRAIAAIVSP